MTRIRWRSSMLVVAALLSAVSVTIGAAPSQASPLAHRRAAAEQEKTGPLAADLADLVRAEPTGGPTPHGVEVDDQHRVRVLVEGASPADVAAAVGQTGGTLAGAPVDTTPATVEAWVPVDRLVALSDSAAVSAVRSPNPVLPQVNRSQGFDNTTQNNGTPVANRTGAANVKAWSDAGRTGSGVKIAVVDVGFANYAQKQTDGELPASVTTKNFCGPTNSDTDGALNFDGANSPVPNVSMAHGTAAAEVVYDMAPSAQMYLVCVDDELDFQRAATYLVAQGVTIASASVGLPTAGRGDGGPVDSGTVGEAMHYSYQHNLLWVVAAGDDGTKHLTFHPTTTNGNDSVNFAPQAPSTNLLPITVAANSTVTVDLKWDAWPTTSKDFDLYVYDSTASYPDDPLSASDNEQSVATPGRPTESLGIANTTSAAKTYYLEVWRFAAGASLDEQFDLYVDGNATLSSTTAAGSILEPGTSPYVLTVGAHCYANGLAEPYTSQGPTIDGRIKPDITGPDGVWNTSVATQSTEANCLVNGANQWGFYGTSAAAPHVAGAAAVVRGANSAFSPGQLSSWLQANATDAGLTGRDDVFGAGRLTLPRGSGANPPPLPVAPTEPPVPSLPPGSNPTTTTTTSTTTTTTSTSTIPGTTTTTTTTPGTPTPARRMTTLAAPVRITDTRAGSCVSGQPCGAVPPGGTIDIPTAGKFGIPSSATAVLLDVVAVGSPGAGFLTVYPTGATRPNASNVNFGAGAVVANQVTAAVGTGGKVSVYNFSSGATDVVVDAIGYYGPSGVDGYQSLSSPVRAVDTRADYAPTFHDVALAPTETVSVAVAGGYGVPSGATAVVLNVTAVTPTQPGFLTVYPGGASRPTASSLNFVPGSVVPNLVVARLGNGAVNVFNGSSGSTHLLVDVIGYYSPDATSGYVPLASPVRTLDTRVGTGGRSTPLGSGEAFDLATGGVNGVPASATAVQVNLTVDRPPAAGFLTLFPAGTARPTASNLNYAAGQVVANAAVSGIGAASTNRAVTVFAFSQTSVLVDVQGYFGPLG